MRVKVEHKILYRIDIIGWHSDYLATMRANPEHVSGYGEDEVTKPSDRYLCTRDMPGTDGVYHPLQWREFNCPHIVTIKDYPRPTIAVWEEQDETTEAENV
jgi:hypothetical protein